jgi:hypothetical protein
MDEEKVMAEHKTQTTKEIPDNIEAQETALDTSAEEETRNFILEAESNGIHLDDGQTASLRELGDKLQFQRQRIAMIQAEKREPKALYLDIFGKEPTGDIEVTFTPTHIEILCHDRNDFESVEAARLSEEEDFTTFAYCMGVPADQAPASWKYTNLVVMVSEGADQESIEHETIHMKNHQIETKEDLDIVGDVQRNMAAKEGTFAEYKTGRIKPEDLVKQLVEIEIKASMRDLGELIKDEILAFYGSGNNLRFIQENLKGSYENKWIRSTNFSSIVESLKRYQNENGADQRLGELIEDENKLDSIIKKAASEVIRDQIGKLLNTIQTLAEKGLSREKITTLLMVTPNTKWNDTLQQIKG